jgi:hypothetical protein
MPRMEGFPNKALPVDPTPVINLDTPYLALKRAFSKLSREAGPEPLARWATPLTVGRPLPILRGL